MVPEEHVRKIESIIGYRFVSKRYIHEALTAAGAEKENHDGNRKLSQIGTFLIDAILALIIYGTNASRESSTNLINSFKKKENYEAVARQTGIDECICYSEKTGSRSSGVLRKALNAIIAAVFLDTWDPRFTTSVILRIFTHKNIENYLLRASSVSTPATDSLSDGVDLFLHQSRNIPRCNRIIDEIFTGEFLNNVADINLWLGAQYSLLSAFAPPFMGPSYGLSGLEGADPIPAEGDWFSPSGIEPNFEIRGLIDGLVELNTQEEATHSINQQCMALNTNAALVQQGRIDYMTSDSGFCGIPLSTEMNMPSSSFSPSSFAPSFAPSSSLPNNCPESSSRHLANPKKRKHAVADPSSPSKDGFLQEYLSRERHNCALLGIPLPEDTYFSHEVQNTLISLGDKDCGPLFTIFVTIAGPLSILALRNIIHNERTERSSQSYLLGNGISPQKRFSVIKELDERATFMQLMKWLHILELFQECGGPGTQSYTGFVINTPNNFGSQTKTPGNQRNLEDNQVSVSMLSEVFPDIKSTDETYKQKLSTFKRLRKLGKRLHTLSSKFGKGIFGLMLDCIPDSGSILSKVLSGLSDSTFNTFVNLLEVSQSDILCRFSAAILPLLDSITNSTVRPRQQYKLEKADDQNIMSKPKGSDALLHLIS